MRVCDPPPLPTASVVGPAGSPGPSGRVPPQQHAPPHPHDRRDTAIMGTTGAGEAEGVQWRNPLWRGGRGAFEGKGPQRRPQQRLGRRLGAVAEAVGGGYCRLQMPLSLALGVRGTVAGHRLGALEGGGGDWLSRGFCMVCIYLNCYFFPCVSLAARDTAATLGGCASVPKCLHVVTD